MSKSNNHDTKVSRRNALQTAAVGTASLFGIDTVGASGSTKRVEIDVLKSGNDTHKTTIVPEPWLNQLNQARNVRDLLIQTLLPQDGVNGVTISRGNRQIEDLTDFSVTVAIDPEGTDAEIPDEANGINIKARAGKLNPAVNCPSTNCLSGNDPGGNGSSEFDVDGYWNDRYTSYSPLRGGNIIQNEVNGYESYGTITCRAWRDETKYLMTARHVLYAGDAACKNGSTVDNPWGYEDTFGGLVEQDLQQHDIVLCDMSGGNLDINNKMAAETGDLVGRVTENGVAWLQSTGKDVEKRGQEQASSQEVGNVISHGGFWGCDHIADGSERGCDIRETMTTEDKFGNDHYMVKGDSGGPIYYEDGSSLYLVHVAQFINWFDNSCSSSTDHCHQATGVTAYSLHYCTGGANGGIHFGGQIESGS